MIEYIGLLYCIFPLLEGRQTNTRTCTRTRTHTHTHTHTASCTIVCYLVFFVTGASFKGWKWGQWGNGQSGWRSRGVFHQENHPWLCTVSWTNRPVRTHTHLSTCIQTHTHTNAHAHTHTHTQMFTLIRQHYTGKWNIYKEQSLKFNSHIDMDIFK